MSGRGSPKHGFNIGADIMTLKNFSISVYSYLNTHWLEYNDISIPGVSIVVSKKTDNSGLFFESAKFISRLQLCEAAAFSEINAMQKLDLFIWSAITSTQSLPGLIPSSYQMR
jgi:hypothetical protein